MTSMCLFGTLYALLPAVFVVLFRSCLSDFNNKKCSAYTKKTSKACFGVPGLPCTKHTLVCSSGMIAIQDAYYTNSTACLPGGLPNCNISVSCIPDTGRYEDLSETQLNNLYKNCSTKKRCKFNGNRNSANVNFSIVKFICIKESFNTCDEVDVRKSNAYLLWKGNNSEDENYSCTCTISTPKSNTYFSLTALDMRLNNTRELCPGVTISVDRNSLPVNCSQLSPYQLLVNTSQQVQVTVNKEEADVNGVVWLRIRGSKNVNVICNKNLPATTDFLSPSTKDYLSTVKSPTAPETVDTSNPTVNVQRTSTFLPTSTTPGASSIRTVIGVVIPCLLIIVAIVLLAVFIIRRKKAKTAKKDDKTNPNTRSQEEYSLAGDVHQNEYFEIEKMAKTNYDNAGFVNTTGNASSKDHEVYSLAGVAHSNEYFEIEPTAPKKSSMVYGYAGLSNTHASPSQNEENVGQTNIRVQEYDYDHVGGKPVIQNGHYDTTASVAKTLYKSNSTDKKGDVYSYDHLNDKTTRENANNDYDVAGRSSDYDTTASVPKRFDHATECREDDYGYNHLGNQVQKKTLQNDYDTSASAVTAVARLNSRL